MASVRNHHFGLGKKLVLALLATGTLPLVLGIGVVYFEGRARLNEVIGGGFEALAEDSAVRLDRDLQRLVAADRLLAARVAAAIPDQGAATDGANADPAPLLRHLRRVLFAVGPGSEDTVLRSRIDLAGHRSDLAADPSRPRNSARISGLRFDPKIGRHFFRISTPLLERPKTWLHRDYDVKKTLDPLVYPIRFGATGHLMVVDAQGTIVSCPLLATGSRIRDPRLVARVVGNRSGWTSADSDGHGGSKFSLIGHAPLSAFNALPGTGNAWYSFVWQDSREIFAATRSLRNGVLVAALLAMSLLILLGYYTSRAIVDPIRKLRLEASEIASGNLDHPLDIRGRDEIGELATQFDDMRQQLRGLIGGLEQRVEERTRELRDAEAEKARIVDELIQAEKVVAIGTLTSGIGHEINNPLYAILGRAEAIRDGGGNSGCRQHATEIVRASRRISEIVRNLSGYAQPATRHDLEPVDVNAELAEAIGMADQALLGERIHYRRNLTPLPALMAKSEEIRQVFFNIVRNGIQAMEGAGSLEISSWPDRGWIGIRIEDSGPGIPEQLRGRIFDPFFTTKDPDKGEGLGLYVVQKIVKKYDGCIDVQSGKGKGVAFIVHFPVSKELSEEESPCNTRY